MKRHFYSTWIQLIRATKLVIERNLFYKLLKTGFNQTETAKEVGVHKSTISRELKRNRGKRGYRHKQAQRFADQRRKKSKRRITSKDWKLIERYPQKDFSPEQVPHWVLKYFDIQVSHEWIYQYIWEDKRNGGKLYKHIRHKKKYRKRSARGDNRGNIPNKTSVEDRPDVVEDRERVGEWEADTIVGKGKKGDIVTLADRKNRFLRIGLVERRTKEAIKNMIIELQKGFPVHTITCDNGKELAANEEISRHWKQKHSLLILMLRGNEELIEIPMAPFANISLRVLTSRIYPRMTFVM